MTTTAPRRYDVILFDSVGAAYTGSTPERQGLGGPELESILLAEALARRGYSVLVLNRTTLPSHEKGVTYANHSMVRQWLLECHALIVARYSPVPPVRYERLVVAVTDLPSREHNHFAPYFARGADVTMVALSEWQRSQFPAAWRSVVIPCILPDEVYSSRWRETKANPHRFIYASAALKGLTETLDAWREIKTDPALADAELVVCTPGYDTVDEDVLARAGVRFLGSLPLARVVEEIAQSAGLLYVNRFPETFGIVAALAEALGRRVHVLTVSEPGALRETVNSPLVTPDRDAFLSAFREAYAHPEDPRFYAAARDYREATVLTMWMDVLGLDGRPSVSRRPAAAPTVCLSMIVKNEAPVIERCLASVKALIDHWAIVDTGSTDGTQDVIRRALEGIPGELHERPWKDFASNRNEALELAVGKATYVLVMDADDVLEFPEGFTLRSLTLDAYELRVLDRDFAYYRVHVFRPDLEFRYVGVLHEVIAPNSLRASGRLPELAYRRFGGGARARDPQWRTRDLAVLREATRREPENTRYVFYLAQTLRDDGQDEPAIAAYEKRVTMAGWAEEVWASLFAIAGLKARSGAPDADVVAAYLRAYEARPSRAEPLCELSRYCRTRNRLALAYVFASAIVGAPFPDDVLWLEEAVYTWRALDEYAIASYYVGRHREAIDANRKLLASPHLPDSERERVERNMNFSTAALAKK